MKQDCFLAIDIGTTNTKAAIVSLDGKFLDKQSEEITIYHPKPRWAEIDSEDWWISIHQSIRSILKQTDISPKQISAIGLCGIMHALVPVDKNGKAIDRMILWMDGRGRSQQRWLIENHGEKIRQITGGYPGIATASVPKLCWLVENKPDVIKQTYKFLLAKDFIRLKLTGEYATDVSDSLGTHLLDRKTRNWSEEFLSIIGLSINQMPRILQSTEIAGYVTKQATDETNLAPGTPVVAGASDVRATLIGANAYVPKCIYLYMGTAAWAGLALEAKFDSNGQPVMNHRWLGATATMGATLKWYRDVLGEADVAQAKKLSVEPYEFISQEAAKVEPGAEGLIFIPHMMGERGKRPNPGAKGVLFGLTLAHRRPHIVRAFMEGNAYLIRQLIDETPGADSVDKILAIGGGAKSKLWREIIANVTNKTVLIPREFECGLLGAAILAGVGIGKFSHPADVARKWNYIINRQRPVSAIVQAYEKPYQLYRSIDAALEKFLCIKNRLR